jgi:sulfoxide reductase catalytic subunit YedY
MPKIKTHIDLDSYHIYLHGEIKNRKYITLDMLKNDFEAVEITVAMQCGGNSRSAFEPTTSGIQWGSGAMGCSTYKGARLKDVLKSAGLTKDSNYITLNGSDEAVMKKIESFKRELKISEISDDTIIAYEQNGEELPFLNGFPVRLIIPGFYADSWVKALVNINVTKEYKEYYYMDTAYRVPDNISESEAPESHASKTKPLELMNVKSYIGYPTSKTEIPVGSEISVKGVAFDEGSGIKEVLVSLDKGSSWKPATLGKELSKYAFREFTFKMRAEKKGRMTIMAKAINMRGEAQAFSHEIGWNHGGYKYNGIDSVTIKVS